jgi:hypothetical protein
MTAGRLRRLLGRLRGEATAEAADDFAPVVSAVIALGEETAGLSDEELREGGASVAVAHSRTTVVRFRRRNSPKER